ncbi:MAG TPA: TlpA disulfide reductase family protein [Streptomyces sp.]|jgi:thiol-disulfide isomerase/thioredoxin|nr:TlpA disulfide reductase family protein [Streptomyces sp.]
MSQSRAFRRRVPVVFAGVAAGALVLAGCGSTDTGSSADNTNFVQGTGEITKIPEGKRKQAPDISGTTVDGKKISLSDYKNKIVVLNVWGSWCAPCRAEAPHLAKVAEQTKDEGVQFIGINTRDHSRTNPQAFERRYDIQYPSFFDPDGKLILKFPRNSLSLQAIPSTVILDRDHKIAVRALTALDEQQLHKALKPLIAEK